MLLQDFVPAEDSKIWELVHSFYVREGRKAWTNEVVPQGATANCYTADAYAAIVATLLRELRSEGPHQRPLIVELGGGNGRFAWYVLQRLLHYHREAGDPEPEFTYLLTDTAVSNLAAWESTDRFSPLRARGLLEFGLCTVEAEPKLVIGTTTVTARELSDRPLVLIANYLFDSIPTDVYWLRDGTLRRLLVALDSNADSAGDGELADFTSITPRYKAVPIERSQTGIPLLDELIDGYPKDGRSFAVPVPKIAFQFVEAFTQRSAPLMLLCGDMGFTDPSQFADKPPLVFDSYFAHYPNFHVIAELFRRQGGWLEEQRQHDNDFCTLAFWMPGTRYGAAGKDPFRETRRTAQAQLREFNPYDTHELLELIPAGLAEASYRQIFSILRLSRFDPVVAQSCIEVLLQSIHRSADGLDRGMLRDIYREVYSLYFPEGSPTQLDYAIAQLFLALKFNTEARELLESSIAEFGPEPERLYVYALALIRCGDLPQAKQMLQQAIDARANFFEAIRAYEQYFGSPQTSAETAHSELAVVSGESGSEVRARQLFEERGVVWLKDLFPRAVIESVRQTFMTRFNEWMSGELGKPNFVGNNRYTVPLRVQAPFNDPMLFANPLLIDLLTEHMGQRPIINAYGAVVTYPGSEQPACPP